MNARLKVTACAAVAGMLFVGTVAAYRQVRAAAPVTELDALMERMANAIDYYDAIDVTFVDTQYKGDTSSITKAEIAMQMRPTPGTRAEITYSNGEQRLMVNDGKQITDFNPHTLTYKAMRAPSPSSTKVPPMNERLVNKNGRSVVIYRESPTGVPAGRMMYALFPQQEVFGYIKREDATTTIEGEDKILGRNVTIVRVETSAVHRHVYDTLKFWVDTETGVLLKQEYWNDGRLVRQQVATTLTFNSRIDPAKFQINIPANAKQIQTEH